MKFLAAYTGTSYVEIEASDIMEANEKAFNLHHSEIEKNPVQSINWKLDSIEVIKCGIDDNK